MSCYDCGPRAEHRTETCPLRARLRHPEQLSQGTFLTNPLPAPTTAEILKDAADFSKRFQVAGSGRVPTVIQCYCGYRNPMLKDASHFGCGGCSLLYTLDHDTGRWQTEPATRAYSMPAKALVDLSCGYDPFPAVVDLAETPLRLRYLDAPPRLNYAMFDALRTLEVWNHAGPRVPAYDTIPYRIHYSMQELRHAAQSEPLDMSACMRKLNEALATMAAEGTIIPGSATVEPGDDPLQIKVTATVAGVLSNIHIEGTVTV